MDYKNKEKISRKSYYELAIIDFRGKSRHEKYLNVMVNDNFILLLEASKIYHFFNSTITEQYETNKSLSQYSFNSKRKSR